MYTLLHHIDTFETSSDVKEVSRDRHSVRILLGKKTHNNDIDTQTSTYDMSVK